MPRSVYVKKKRAKPYHVVNTIAMIGAKNTMAIFAIIYDLGRPLLILCSCFRCF